MKQLVVSDTSDVEGSILTIEIVGFPSSCLLDENVNYNLILI